MSKRWLWVPMLLLVSSCGYNQIQVLDEQAKKTRSNIDTELTRRNDLIPNLVATVEGAANFEKSTYTQVAQARAGLNAARQNLQTAIQNKAPANELSQADAAVGQNLRTFLNVAVEAYPQLKANQNFIGLQDELTETENRVNVARRDYNDAVQAYNSYIRQFPQVLTAKATGASQKEGYSAPASSSTPPTVKFGGPSATP
jgi:LemA protein